jgi:hypothetical protein
LEIVLHLGLHCTDSEHLLRCLLKNKGALAPAGIVVPGPGRYRPVLREAINRLSGAPASPDMQEALLDAILDQDKAERVILSHDNFLCAPDKVVADGMLYPKADKIAWFANLFPDAAMEACLAIRNPASLLPELRSRIDPAAFDAELARVDADGLSWAGMVERMRDAAPSVPLTVWCDEDTPLIWPEVVRAVAGCDPELELANLYDRVAELMRPEGLASLTAYLAASPPLDEEHRRRVVSAFLDKFVPAEALAVEPAMPGWTEADIAAMTQAYEEDLREIAAMPGVRLIQP